MSSNPTELSYASDALKYWGAGWQGVSAVDFSSHVRVVEPDGCWEWSGSIGSNGYPRLFANGKTYAAHRLSWALSHQRNPGKWFIRHTCDNPPCVNPAHLKCGTPWQNSQDAVQRNRTRGNATTWRPQTKCFRGHDLTLPGSRVSREGSAVQRRGECRICAIEKRRERRAAKR